ncbi:MAG: ABC transporter permease [Bacteroidaceae bacterium]|nr:ABC transporter permease [Bacteroidaceae bacterium]
MKQAFRLISRMKGYTALSLLGLVISLSGTVIISRYLYQEWTVDHWMSDLDRTFICCVQWQNSAGWVPMVTYDPNHQSQFISPVLGQSDVECWTNVQLRSMFLLKPEQGEAFYPQAISVDSMFTQVFPLETVEGTLVLRTKGQCILSEQLAKRLFPDESAVGKTITVEDNEVNTVMGVFSQPATKTSIRFDIANFSDEDKNVLEIGIIRLREGADVQAYNDRQPEQRLNLFSCVPVRFGLQPYTQMLQKSSGSYRNVFGCLVPVASARQLWMLLFVAILLLFVGLFNFVNLFAVMRRHRRHELEVRRLFGASRWDIFCQLYAETFLLAVLTMIGVWTVVELAEPLLATYYNIEVMGQWRFDVALTLFTVIGLPLLSNVTTPFLQGRVRGGSAGAFLFLQFFISLALLNVSLYFMRQLHVMMTTDPGFRTEGLLSACIYPPNNRRLWSEEEWKALIANYGKQTEVVKQRLQACPYIKGITVDSRFIDGNVTRNLADGRNVDIMYIGGLEAQMYGLQLVEGVLPGDSLSMEDYTCVATESAIRALGIKDRNTDLVQFDERFWYRGDKDCSGNPPYRIIGVVRDFNPGRQSEPVPPILLMFDSWMTKYDIYDAHQMQGRDYLMEVAEDHEDDIIRELKALEKELYGTTDLKYQWVEDERKALYKEDQRTARIFVTFSLLAIAVTCLGVLGLMMFDVRRRYREIALRKVNGATFLDIALLLSRRYLIVFGIAAVASLPVSLLAIHRLMASYTIRTSFAWWIPLVSIAIVLLLCALTLWQQVWKATRIRPYEVLKEN